MALKVSSDLDKETRDARRLGPLMRREAWRRLLTVSFNMEREIKFTLPVDTGRLRASWSHWTPADKTPGKKWKGAAIDAFYKERKGELSIAQGSNVEYLGDVNDLGFGPQFRRKTIDQIEDEHQDQLDRLIDDMLRLIV